LLPEDTPPARECSPIGLWRIAIKTIEKASKRR